MTDETTGSVPWTFWLIGAVAMIWHVMGVINYLSQMNPDALATYSDAARALVAGRPAWATGAFAVGVFGGALGCLLLLLRKPAAHYAFIASLVGVVATNIHTAGVTVTADIWVGSLLSLLVAALLIWYSKLAARKGWVR